MSLNKKQPEKDPILFCPYVQGTLKKIITSIYFQEGAGLFMCSCDAIGRLCSIIDPWKDYESFGVKK